MMQMQENNEGIEELSCNQYYDILDKLNKSICFINKFKHGCSILDESDNKISTKFVN